MELELKDGRCPVCGSNMICGMPGFWKCMCGATSTGFIVGSSEYIKDKR